MGSNLDPSGDLPVSTLEEAISSCSNIASFQFRDDSSPPTSITNGAAPSLQPSTTEAETLEPPSETTPLLPQTTATAPPSTTNGTITTTTQAGLSLTTQIQPSGSNFSHGQRQVLSLCRALVRKSKLMLLDEATASMDYETDKGIQAVLRKEMNMGSSGSDDGEASRKRTLVTVAHRLRTIVDYDKVVVMGGGKVLETGAPKELYKRKGVFFDMVRFSGEGEDLERLMDE